MIGSSFGRLTVLQFSHYSGKHRKHWLCRCICGAEKTVQQTLLKNGNTKSCGCLARDVRRATRLPNDKGVINQIILQYQRHARDRSIRWQLSYEEVECLLRGGCHYCGIVGGNIKRTKNHDGFRYNGIDRKNRSLPYVGSNVVPCCGRCNMAKGSMSEEEFILHAITIAEQWGDFLIQSTGRASSIGADAAAGGVSIQPPAHIPAAHRETASDFPFFHDNSDSPKGQHDHAA